MISRFRYCRDPVFLSALALYLMNRWFFKPLALGHTVFFQYWGNHLLFIPLFLPPWLYINRLLRLRRPEAYPTRFEIVVHTIVWSLFCYWLAPVVIRGPFAWKAVDPWDPVACLAGALIAGMCWGIWRRRPDRVSRPKMTARRET
jgi:hypothetical protein